MTEELNEYATLWGSAMNEYLLISLAPPGIDPKSCVIFHRNKRTALVIEDNDVARAVIQRMADAGVEIVDRMPSDAKPSPSVHQAIES